MLIKAHCKIRTPLKQLRRRWRSLLSFNGNCRPPLSHHSAYRATIKPGRVHSIISYKRRTTLVSTLGHCVHIITVLYVTHYGATYKTPTLWRIEYVFWQVWSNPQERLCQKAECTFCIRPQHRRMRRLIANTYHRIFLNMTFWMHTIRQSIAKIK